MSDLLADLGAVSWRIHNGEAVTPMEKALIELCGQAADEIEALTKAARDLMDTTEVLNDNARLDYFPARVNTFAWNALAAAVSEETP